MYIHSLKKNTAIKHPSIHHAGSRARALPVPRVRAPLASLSLSAGDNGQPAFCAHFLTGVSGKVVAGVLLNNRLFSAA